MGITYSILLHNITEFLDIVSYSIFYTDHNVLKTASACVLRRIRGRGTYSVGPMIEISIV
jgi:hypothetical protein